MSSSVSIPITLRLRLAGSGLFLSARGGPLVQTILPHRAGPPGAHGATRMTAIFSATSQSPVGSAARAGLLSPAKTSAASQGLRTQPALIGPPGDSPTASASALRAPVVTAGVWSHFARLQSWPPHRKPRTQPSIRRTLSPASAMLPEYVLPSCAL